MLDELVEDADTTVAWPVENTLEDVGISQRSRRQDDDPSGIELVALRSTMLFHAPDAIDHPLGSRVVVDETTSHVPPFPIVVVLPVFLAGYRKPYSAGLRGRRAHGGSITHPQERKLSQQVEA